MKAVLVENILKPFKSCSMNVVKGKVKARWKSVSLQLKDRAPEAIHFWKEKCKEIFDIFQIILILSAAFSIEKEEMTSSLLTIIKGTYATELMQQ